MTKKPLQWETSRKVKLCQRQAEEKVSSKNSRNSVAITSDSRNLQPSELIQRGRYDYSIRENFIQVDG